MHKYSSENTKIGVGKTNEISEKAILKIETLPTKKITDKIVFFSKTVLLQRSSAFNNDRRRGGTENGNNEYELVKINVR